MKSRWLFPFVLRVRHEAAVELERERGRQELNRVRRVHEQELSEVEGRVGSIVRKCSDVRFDRAVDDSYMVTMRFDPRMMAMGRMDRNELKIIAREFSRRVEQEIVACKFVEPPRREG